MISKYTYKGLTWVDLESPTREEISHIQDEYDISGMIAEELSKESLRSKVDLYENGIYLILHFPVVRKAEGKMVPEQEIDFIIGDNYIITAHYEHIPVLHEFTKMFEVNSFLERGINSKHAGYVFTYMLKQIYGELYQELDHISDALRTIEHKIFQGKEEEMVRGISDTHRTLLDFKQALRFHGTVLSSFEKAAKEFFDEKFSYQLSVVTGEYNKLYNLLESQREILGDLRETNDSLLSAKVNETMRTLTIMTFVMLPITVIAGVFGMNTSDSIVFIRNFNDFLLVIGAMSVTGLVIFLFFKIKRWI